MTGETLAECGTRRSTRVDLVRDGMPIASRISRTAVAHRTVITVVAAVTMMTGCGDPSESSAGPEGGGSTPPATRAVVPRPEPGDADYVTVTAVVAADVAVPCPGDEHVDMNAIDSSILIDESSRLEPMLGVVLQYGTEHQDVFGGYGFHWHTAGDASVFVSFTGDIDGHQAALAELVEYPDELIVCQAAASEADRIAIEATLVEELGGRFTELSSGGKSGAVTVGLNPTEESLAAELVERYGAAIHVTVGALRYPLADAVSVCEAAPEPSLIEGLEVEILDAVQPLVMTEAGTVPLRVQLTNVGNQPIRFNSGQPSAVITDAQGGPRTRDSRAGVLVGIEVALGPGASQTFDVDVRLASCDPSVGYVLPPGDHFLVVSIYNGELKADMSSAPLPITIERDL